MDSVSRTLRFIVLLLLTILSPGKGQVRYQNLVFPSCDTTFDIQYGQAATLPLYLDVYTGTGDTAKNRPLAVFIHAGGFQTGTKTTSFGKMVCSALARRGYVAASIEYRLTSSIIGDTACFEAMMRALHDAKAAVRFFRKNGTTYGVDTSRIFAVGSSAGSITALHLAYLDSAEVPAYVNWSHVDNSFEGSSGNPGYSSRVQGVISNWGALGDTAWLKTGDVPVYCVHGTSDSTIYYNLIPAYGPFKYSSKYIIMAAQQKGIPNGLRLFYGTGHELGGDTTKQDSAINDFSAWLFAILNGTASSVRKEMAQHPVSAVLGQNYPNPFNPRTTIRYELPVSSNVKFTVYDLLGREVFSETNINVGAGVHEVSFDGSNIASGIYLYRLEAGDFIQTRKLVLLK